MHPKDFGGKDRLKQPCLMLTILKKVFDKENKKFNLIQYTPLWYLSRGRMCNKNLGDHNDKSI